MSSDRRYRSSQAVAFGRNYFHALGGCRETSVSDPLVGHLRIHTWKDPPWHEDEDEKIVQVVCTAQSTVFLTSNGSVYQTGTFHGRVYRSPSLITIPLPLKCVQVSAGRHFCIGKMEGGLAVVTWGAGHFGQLGVATNEQDAQITFTPHPVVVERLLPHVIGSPTQQVAAGDWHALALNSSGRVWAWGSNRSFQCGRKPTIKSTTAAPTLTAPLPVPLDDPVTQIAAGRSHSVAIVDGQVYCWGATNHGQCGNVVRRSGVVPPKKVEGLMDCVITEVAAGGNHTLALTGGGRLFAWGSGTEGELGLGVDVPAQVKPRLVGDLDFVAIAAGQEWKNQQRGNRQPTDPAQTLAEVPKIAHIYAGASYSVAVSSSGHLYTWGSNDAGQMGLPTPTSLPLRDNINPTPIKTSTIRDMHVSTFDSFHNVLLPTRIDAAREIFVRTVGCGPNHMWCVGEQRSPEQKAMPIGKTLYEVQEDQRMLKLQRARDSLLSKLQQQVDEGATEGTTTQTDNEDQQDDNPDYLEHSAGVHWHPLVDSATYPYGYAATPSTAEPATPSSVQSRDTAAATPDVGDEQDALNPRAHRRRFSIPRMLRRLSLGHKAPDRPDEGDAEAEGSRTPRRRRDKRYSM